MRPIPGFPGYFATEEGEVIKTRYDKFLTVKASIRGGYARMSARDSTGRWRTVEVYKLVLSAFAGPCPPGMECRHLDGDSLNNRPENLAWGTRKENAKDAAEHGTASWLATRSKLSIGKVIEIKTLLAQGYGVRTVAVATGTPRSTVFNISRGRNHRQIKPNAAPAAAARTPPASGALTPDPATDEDW